MIIERLKASQFIIEVMFDRMIFISDNNVIVMCYIFITSTGTTVVSCPTLADVSCLMRRLYNVFDKLSGKINLGIYPYLNLDSVSYAKGLLFLTERSLCQY